MSGLEPRPERYLSELSILLLIENDAFFSCVNLGVRDCAIITCMIGQRQSSRG